jgi:choline transport protein
MMLSLVISAISVIPWTLAFMFSTNDLEAVGSSRFPILEVYQQALNNRSGATFLAVWLLVVYFGSIISATAATGRLTWAFARDNGLPFSPTLAKIHPRLQMPVNATCAASVFVAVYGAIYVGSTTAFNSFISMSILSLNVTYAIPQGIVFFRGRDKILPSTRHFNLGKLLGPFCNIFTVLWVSLYTVLFCLPVYGLVLSPNILARRGREHELCFCCCRRCCVDHHYHVVLWQEQDVFGTGELSNVE